jgi:hypothetical protein
MSRLVPPIRGRLGLAGSVQSLLVVLVIVVVIWLLQVFGALGSSRDIRIR